MSDRDEDRPSEAPDLAIPELPELPPLDDGEPEPVAADAPVELDGGGDDEDDGGAAIEGPSVEEMARELSDFEDAEWSDDLDGSAGIADDAPFDEVEEAWADGVDTVAPLDDDWFADEADGEAIEDDGGAAGPLEEPDDALADADEESAAQYLGPVRGRVVAVAMLDGALLAAGDGLYRVGADGLLHRYDAEDEIDAVSICAAGTAVFLGTERRGVLRGEGFDRALAPVGGVWRDARRATERQLPGPFTIFGQRLEDRYRLVGRTEDGDLLASDDAGHTWRGPLTERRCLAVAPWEGETSILALVDGDDGPALLLGDGRGQWRRLGARFPAETADREQRISIAAAGGVIAVGSDRPGAPLWISMDCGESFCAVASVHGVTAIAVDAHEPGWIAAAICDPDAGVGVVRVSRDGGKTWRTAFTTYRTEEREDPVYRPGRVTSLTILGDGARVLYAATGEGVYGAPLPVGRVAH